MLVSSQNSYVEILTSNVMVSEGGPSGKRLDPEGGALMHGTNALINETPKSSHAPPFI